MILKDTVKVIEFLCFILYICIFHRQVLMYVLVFTTNNAFPLHFFSKEARTINDIDKCFDKYYQ